MGLSRRGYARHRGVTDKAVGKALDAGRIHLEADGTIDPLKADQHWAEMTDFEKSASEKAQPSFVKIKTAHELYKAQITQLSLQEKKRQLISKEQVRAEIFKLGRQMRDHWLHWPARVAAIMAAELGVEEHKLHSALERHVREHLHDIGDERL